MMASLGAAAPSLMLSLKRTPGRKDIFSSQKLQVTKSGMPIPCTQSRPFNRRRILLRAQRVASTAVLCAAALEDLDSEIATENGASAESDVVTEDEIVSAVKSSLQFYKEALADGDQSKVSEIEAFLQSIEDEKNSLADKVATLSQELTIERERILRISADFDNFRKRTEKERLSLMNNVQGDVLESLLPVLDNFERAKTQIKAETNGEEKINNSYQSIYKQFMEILTSLGVEAVETVGHAFDPMMHEAIMREESVEFEEGVITQEFRKGFRLGDRLLRPSMVKVSAGPGPETPSVDTDGGETNQESPQEGDDSV